MSEDSFKKLNKLLEKQQLDKSMQDELLNIIMPIFSSDEFQKRMKSPYFHHNKITLGEHLLEDTIVTYKLSKEYIKKHPHFDLSVALQISMLHDLYTFPWQNNKKYKAHKFYNKHGFRHPIEAAINAIAWHPDLFKDKDNAYKVIDGIVSHMYPLPVRRYNTSDTNKLELNNYDILKSVDRELEEMLITLTNKMKLGPFSFKIKVCPEGRIMRKADKIVSLNNFRGFKNFKSSLSLVTGTNKHL